MVKDLRDPVGVASRSWSRPVLAVVALAAALALVWSFGSLTKPGSSTSTAAINPAAQQVAAAGTGANAATAPRAGAAAAPKAAAKSGSADQHAAPDAAAKAPAALAPAPASKGAAGKAGVAPTATKTVMIVDFAYSPATLTVAPGDTVTWMNHDSAPHNVIVTAGPEKFSSPTLETGESFSFKFTKAGTYEYYCSIHPNMKASVTVTGGTDPSPDPEPTPTSSPDPDPEPEPDPDSCEALDKTVNAFLAHFYAAHLERSPFGQVEDILDLDNYVKIHTVLIEDMLKPQLGAVSVGSSAALTTFLQHLYAAHLERSPFEQVGDIADLDQYVLTHTVMVENMVKPLLDAELSSC